MRVIGFSGWSGVGLCVWSVVAGCAGYPPDEIGVETGSAQQALLGASLSFEFLGSITTGTAPGPGAEISTYDPTTYRVFSINPTLAAVDVIELSDPRAPVQLESWSVPGIPNSIAVRDGVVAIAVAAENRTDPGLVQFRSAASGAVLSQVTVGAQPDMLVFTPNGRAVLVANEGEPSDDYTVDPEGSVSVIDTHGSPAHVSQRDVRTVSFAGSTPVIHPESVRIFGPNASFAQDLEPEYITVSHDSRRAWVTLQENNAIGILDIDRAEFDGVVGLGFKDWNAGTNRFDASDRDGPGNTALLNLQPWAVSGMYQPDGIASFPSSGRTLLVTANEGDARAYPGFSEETRARDLYNAGKLSPASPAYAAAASNAQLGRLRVTNATGDTDGDGKIDRLFAYGARSFSIWTDGAELIYDSGAELEERLSVLLPTAFNSNHDANSSFDSRSDDKGPEPESVVVRRLWGTWYAFIGLERVGGVIAYDLTDPLAPSFAGYVNRRDFTVADLSLAGDLGPEGLVVIPAALSPNGEPLLMVSNEVSVTTSFFRIAR